MLPFHIFSSKQKQVKLIITVFRQIYDYNFLNKDNLSFWVQESFLKGEKIMFDTFVTGELRIRADADKSFDQISCFKISAYHWTCHVPCLRMFFHKSSEIETRRIFVQLADFIRTIFFLQLQLNFAKMQFAIKLFAETFN